MLLAGALVLTFCLFAFGTPPKAFLLLVPTGFVTFALSLIIGHFLAEPLNVLVRKTETIRSGGHASFVPDGRLYEADELSRTINLLVKKTKSQQIDLSLKESRQAAFISDVAHELRTPLTAIRGNAEMLTDHDLPAEMHQKFCSIIIGESERLSRLTNDLLTLQRIENDTTPMELSRVNLNALAHSVLDALEPILRKREALTSVIGETPDVLGNLDRLKQAVTNLVENASRFIDPGGHISIELFGLRGNSILTVKDDGTGFGDVDPKLLFDRFYRTDSSRSRDTGGTGLGLAIVKSVIEAHDGTVEAINLPGKGACFILAIPSIPGDTIGIR